MPSEGLRPVTTRWMEKLRMAREHKRKEFQADADEASRFFDGPYDWLYQGWRKGTGRAFALSETDEDLPGPSVEMTVNKTAELVQLFGPALYHRNPYRRVNPRQLPAMPAEFYGDPNDPNVQAFVQQQQMRRMQAGVADRARAMLLEHVLNYTPDALDLKTQSRWAIDEALIKGMGLLWTMPTSPAAGGKLVGSYFGSVDELFLDPDAETLDECKWAARRCRHPIWQVEQQYGLAPGTLRSAGTLESYSQAATVNAQSSTSDNDGDWLRKKGESCDLITYYKVWSKMGLGGRLSGMNANERDRFDSLGEYVYLVVTDGCHWPLNVPQQLCDLISEEDPNARTMAAQQAQQFTQWETPYWADDGWPFTPIVFHQRPRKLWPMSHMKPAMGELQFLNWAYSLLASKIRIACRDFIAIAKSAGEELKNRIKHGADFSILDVEALHGSIDNVVKFLQHPGFNPEIYKVIEGVTQNFERRTGLNELMYGLSAKQMRSAQEAAVKGDAISVRPDDMATKVEEAMTDVSRREAFCLRWHLRGQDLQGVLGQDGAQAWEQLLVVGDPATVLRSLEYRIEANSIRKPNRNTESENMRNAVQNLFQPLFSYAQSTGDVGPINALISDWARSIDLDASGYQLKPPPPPPAPPAQPAPQQKGPPR